MICIIFNAFLFLKNSNEFTFINFALITCYFVSERNCFNNVLFCEWTRCSCRSWR